MSGAGIELANIGNTENRPMITTSTQPPVRRSASSTRAHIATADQTIQVGATLVAAYSQPLAADSRALQISTHESAVATAKRTTS